MLPTLTSDIELSSTGSTGCIDLLLGLLLHVYYRRPDCCGPHLWLCNIDKHLLSKCTKDLRTLTRQAVVLNIAWGATLLSGCMISHCILLDLLYVLVDSLM